MYISHTCVQVYSIRLRTHTRIHVWKCGSVLAPLQSHTSRTPYVIATQCPRDKLGCILSCCRVVTNLLASRRSGAGKPGLRAEYLHTRLAPAFVSHLQGRHSQHTSMLDVYDHLSVCTNLLPHACPFNSISIECHK